MRLSRRSALGGLAGLLATLFSRRNGTAHPTVAEDPIRLVDGWLLRQSDLDALATRDRYRR